MLAHLVAVSDAITKTRSRLEKTRALAELLARTPQDEVKLAVTYLSGFIPQGRIGVGYAQVKKLSDVAPASSASLGLKDVDAMLTRFAEEGGTGSAARKLALLAGTFAQATHAEQSFLSRLLVGELRQGALEGVMSEAIAQAAKVSVGSVRRAWMFSQDAGRVATEAMQHGEAGLTQFRLELFRPLQPMLAQPGADFEETMGGLEEVALEDKLDGARIQVHRSGDLVRVFSRDGNEVTLAVPEVVEATLALPVRSLVLDGEAIALRADGTPHPFQQTMRRFGRKSHDSELVQSMPLSPFFFDVLHLDGADTVDATYVERMALLDGQIPERHRISRLLTRDPEAAQIFYDEALARGHEGVLLKDARSTYEAGRRGGSWVKFKPAHTLDLVVLAAEWGGGRRQGWLSNLHLGARDPATGGFVMLGKTFKGLTDAMLEWQTKWFLEHELSREGHTVHVKPELVVEIAFDTVQASPHYAGGMALRFARVKRFRPDKSVTDSESVETLREILRKSHGPSEAD